MATQVQIKSIRKLIFDVQKKILDFTDKINFPLVGLDYILYRSTSDMLVYYYDEDRGGYIEFIDDNKPDWLYFSDDDISGQFDLVNNEYLAACNLISMMLVKMARDLELEKISSGIETTTYSDLKTRYQILRDAKDRYTDLASDKKQTVRSGRIYKAKPTYVAGMDERDG